VQVTGGRLLRRLPKGSQTGATMAVDDIVIETGADKARAIAERLPRLVRFAVVGGLGLLTDLAVFTMISGLGHHPLAARLASLGIATLVTWRLNRLLTFARSNRAQTDEAMRYLAVTAVAQGTSYAVFATLVLTVLAALPQAALIGGAVAGAFVSYNGHRLFAFAPSAHPTVSRAITPRGLHRT
jgi:putative flippase GtrA